MPPPGRVPLVFVALAGTLAVTACGSGRASGTPAGAGTDVLVIVTATPAPSPRVSPRAETDPYVVQEGDTLSDLAARFGVSEVQLREANGIGDPDSLFVGQELRVPTPEP